VTVDRSHCYRALEGDGSEEEEEEV
jgi:hypothetical protein